MAIRITDDTMIPESAPRRSHRPVRCARRSQRQWRAERSHAPGPAVPRDQAITALTLAERTAVGYGDEPLPRETPDGGPIAQERASRSRCDWLPMS